MYCDPSNEISSFVSSMFSYNRESTCICNCLTGDNVHVIVCKGDVIDWTKELKNMSQQNSGFKIQVQNLWLMKKEAI